MGIRSLFCFGSSHKKSTDFSSPGNEFPWKDCAKWQTMSEGYEAEGYAGTIRCSGCKSEINAYRQVTLKDVLRLEQEIEGGRGRCTLHLPITFNSEAAKWSGKSEIDEDKVVIGRYRNNASGVRYDVLKEVFFASIKCINCGEVMHMYDRIVRYDGKNTQNWVLSRKDPKALEDEKFDY